MRRVVAERRWADFDIPALLPRVCSHMRWADVGRSAIYWGQRWFWARGFEADAEKWVLDPFVAERILLPLRLRSVTAYVWTHVMICVEPIFRPRLLPAYLQTMSYLWTKYLEIGWNVQDNPVDMLRPWTGHWFNTKMPSYQYRDSHYIDETVVRPSYLHNDIFSAGMTTSLCWTSPQGPILLFGKIKSLKCHWGRMTHLCVSRLTITGSDNGLLPGQRQAIIWTNAGILLIGPLGTNFSENSIKILTFSFTKMRLKVSSVKWRPFCLGLNVLRRSYKVISEWSPVHCLYSVFHLKHGSGSGFGWLSWKHSQCTSHISLVWDVSCKFKVWLMFWLYGAILYAVLCYI